MLYVKRYVYVIVFIIILYISNDGGEMLYIRIEMREQWEDLHPGEQQLLWGKES